MAEERASDRYRILALSKQGKILQDDKVVGAQEAWLRARSLALDFDAQTIRIIDDDDSIGAEWDRDKGVVFPLELAGRRFAPWKTVHEE
jgi:hypothetical protein